jgi:hypothetical protein
MISRLKWGLAYAVPPEATGAWGCRAIISQDGHVDLVPDRTDQTGEEIILDILTREYNPSTLREDLAAKLRAHKILTTRRGRFTLHKSRLLAVLGDTNGSGGYCYLCAWTTFTAADLRAERASDVIDRAVSRGDIPG